MSFVRPLPLRPCLRIARNASARFYASSSSPSKVVFSGIQPTGVPHLGNYLGALQQWVELQNSSSASPGQEVTRLYSLVDLHAITVKQDPEQLKRWRKESLATLLAIGLDPKRSILFYQSEVRDSSSRPYEELR
jgi:tryptophanyl-tRNA synthetase